MKYLLYFILIFSLVFFYSSLSKNKDNDQDSLLNASGLTANWLTDYSAARAKAEVEGKPLMINFTGSNWCSGCVRLNKEIFRSQFLSITQMST